MTQEEILNRLTPIIDGLRMMAFDGPITPASNVRTDLGLESLDYIDFVLQSEIAFGIKVTPEESAAITTVGDFVNLIQQKLNDK